MSDVAGTTSVETFARLFAVEEAEVRTLSKRGFLPPIRKGRLATADAIAKMAAFLAADLVTVPEAGGRLGVSGQWIRRLQSDGYIPAANSKGVVQYRDVANGYIRWLKDDARRSSKSASATAVQEARASEIALRVAERRRDLIRMDEAISTIDDVFGPLKSELAGVPARATRDIALRKHIEAELDAALGRAVKRLHAASAALLQGKDHFER